ncbi:Histone-lysine N-methyltransferase eggless [Papilio xuthus]|uniref:Histone-lysine N-methyltransferase eggless n=1 Tax=Papilio xuthus TaxID=66420 RepID=A0A194PSL4_PAPXU|nr:Histone-lysine N-methyltransferase eggless [Papilio xuthus]
MDVTDNFEDIISESNFETDGSPEAREEKVTSQNPENRVDEITPTNASLDDILVNVADDDSKDIKEMSDEQKLPLKSDGKDIPIEVPIQEAGDGTEESYLKLCVKSDAVITSTNIGAEMSTVNKSLMEYFDTTSNNDNDVKSNIDEDNNSDVLDEDLQLRWDDDENDGDNVISSADEEELLKENTDTLDEKAQKEDTDSKELNEQNVRKEKVHALKPTTTDKYDKYVSTDSIQKIEEIVTQHGLKKPDMMLEIPTQELMDFMDEDDEPDLSNLDILPDIEKGQNSPKDEDEMDINNLKTLINADLQLDDDDTNTTEIVQTDSKDSENINANVSVSLENNEALTDIVSKDMDPVQLKDDGNQQNIDKTVDEPQPSTSKASAITEMKGDSDEVEHSNEMVVEYSEDSNAVNSDLDIVKITQSDAQEPTVSQTDSTLCDEQIDICEFSVTDNISQEENINKNIETIEEMETDITMFEAEKNDENNEEIGHKMILDKELEQDEPECLQSPATIDIDNGDEVSNKLPEESEQDENSMTINETQSLSAPESEKRKNDNVVLLDSSSEDEKENSPNIQMEKEEPSLNDDIKSNSGSPQNENSTDEIVEKMDTDKINSPNKEKKQSLKLPIGLEVFNVDSDEEELGQNDMVENVEQPVPIKCVNPKCQSPNDTKFYAAEADVLKFYEMEHKKKAAVCESCANVFDKHIQDLLNRFKNFTPLLDLHNGKSNQDLVEIYDSESEEEDETEENGNKIGTSVAKFLEDNLADVFNTSWEKYNMDSRLAVSENELQQDLNNLQVHTEELDKMLKECQAATDTLRNNLYATFEVDRKTLPSIAIVDTPTTMYCCYENNQSEQEPPQTRLKRRLMTNTDTPAKRLLTTDKMTFQQDKIIDGTAAEANDDNVDVSVVKLSREPAPAELPPRGVIIKPALRAGMSVYAMKTTFGLWIKAKIVEILPKLESNFNCFDYYTCIIDDDSGVMYDQATKTSIKQSETVCPESTVTRRSRRIYENKVPKVKKIPKTGAERIRAYRNRILEYELEMAARSMTIAVTNPKEITPLHNLENEQITSPDIQNTILYNALTRPTKEQPEHNNPCEIESSTKFTNCRVKFEYKSTKNFTKHVTGRRLAYSDPPDVRLIIGTRIIACAEKTDSFYSGVVAEVPNPVNKFRYLVFFDDGHAKYVQHADTRLVCECSRSVWEEVHPYSQEFVRQYLLAYPERPMVRLRPKQNLKTEWQGQWWNSRVLQVDASLAEIELAGKRREWIYRGSTRLAPLYLELQAAERHRTRPMPRSGPQVKSNMPYVEYTRYDEPSKSPSEAAQQNEELRRQRAVAKKSTAQSQPPPQPTNIVPVENILSRVVHYKPKNAVRPLHMVPHECGPQCRRSDVLPLKDLRTYNPLTKPLLSGWERQLIRYKTNKIVMYRAPCGRRLRDMPELHRYLRLIDSDMAVDLFDFSPATHCLAEFVLNNCNDLSHGKEIVPVPCVNYYDGSLPEFCSYNTERTPTAGVPLNLDPNFLCGCDCEDDCEDKSKCACWKMTLEGARTIGMEGDVGYVYRRLPEPLPSGIYECNSRCKCRNTCLNRVAQHPLQLKLQVFKTDRRGWGIRALNDVPKGAFLCVYAGNLLTDATANLDGLNEGDEYLAELDYIEVVEAMKEGYEEDVPESLKENDDESDSSESSEEDDSSEEKKSKTRSSKDEDDEFRPGYVDLPLKFNKHLRTREKCKKEKEDDEMIEKKKEKAKEKEKEVEKEEKKEIKKDGDNENENEDCITISDDEEVREPSSFSVQEGMDSKQLVSKYRSVRSYFGKDEACYIMDAKVQGNIGRYLNHSCCPNVFVQNVFVDTHDPRFPWVAFFASTHIRAGVELTWNYNYDVGSVPGKVLYCYCGADNCRGRLL